MKTILATLTIAALSVSASFAGCGKTETTSGKLKSVNTETKTIVVESGGKDVKATLTPKTTGADGLDKLVGKDVTVVTSHGKAESVKKG